MELENWLPRYGEAFLRLLYPSVCALCDQLLELEERSLCLPCHTSLERLKFSPSEERIRLSFAYGDKGWVLFRYEDPVKEILHQIKFGGRRDLLQIFTPEITSLIERRPELWAYDCLLPIPLDGRRLSERQFNQSGLLADKIHEILKGGRGKGPRLERKVLVKRHSTFPQSLLGRESRRLNLHRVFQVPHPRKIQGRSVLLIDDIFTTGATLEEAAKTLKEAGASRVGFLALARAGGN